LAALHVFQSALDGLIVALFFLLLRVLLTPGHLAAAVTGLFAFWPVHGETHYWLTSASQNLISTWFVLLFAMSSLAGARMRWRWWLWLLDAVAFFGGLFTYDQAAGVLVAIAIARITWERRWRFALAHTGYFAGLVLYVGLKLRIVPGSAPVLSAGS